MRKKLLYNTRENERNIKNVLKIHVEIVKKLAKKLKN